MHLQISLEIVQKSGHICSSWDWREWLSLIEACRKEVLERFVNDKLGPSLRRATLFREVRELDSVEGVDSNSPSSVV